MCLEGKVTWKSWHHSPLKRICPRGCVPSLVQTRELQTDQCLLPCPRNCPQPQLCLDPSLAAQRELPQQEELCPELHLPMDTSGAQAGPAWGFPHLGELLGTCALTVPVLDLHEMENHSHESHFSSTLSL